MKSRLLGAVCAGLFTLITTSTNAALFDNGGGLIYDDKLDITWAQPDTVGTWWGDANTRAAGLTLGGVSGWRLPYISVAAGAGPFTGTPVDCSTATEVACRDNELGYMFYQNLSGTIGQPILTSGDPDLALFPTLQSSTAYWSGTEFNFFGPWCFSFDDGRKFLGLGGSSFYSWAVHAGNVVGSVSKGLVALVDLVMGMNLQAGISNALDSKLSNVLSAIDDDNANNDGAVLNMMYAFCSNAEAQRGKHLTDAQTDELIAAASRVILLQDEYATPCE